jgi:hypothetical protein
MRIIYIFITLYIIYKLNLYFINNEIFTKSCLFIIIPSFTSTNFYENLDRKYPFLFKNNIKLIRSPIYFVGIPLQYSKDYVFQIHQDIAHEIFYNPQLLDSYINDLELCYYDNESTKPKHEIPFIRLSKINISKQ